MVGTDVPRLTFGQEHFGEASLGDERRTRSLVDLADRFSRHPHGSLPAKCKDPNVLRRCYDLMNVPAVTHEAVLAAPVQRTLRLMRRQTGPVLIVHDGSELDYSGLTSLHGQLGQIGNGFGKGYECLNSLAVLPHSRAVLGLVGQLLHVRPRVPKEETRAERRDREDRESLLWLKAVDAVAEADGVCRRREGAADASEGPTMIDVVDRGGDTFEFMDHEEVVGRRYLLRSKHNRCIRIGHEGAGPPSKLHDYLRSLPEQGRRPLSLPERAGRPARQTTIAVAWAAVELTPSKEHRAGGRRQPLRTWALRVWEPTPPTKGEEVEWLLLTNLAAPSAEWAWEKVDWYCCRWQIEEFHKAQKTGCAIEELQFERVERLRLMIALLSVVATTLLGLRDQSRDQTLRELPATEAVDAEQVEVLSGWRYGRRRALTAGEFFQALARLGGHQGRRGDGEPGWQVLWRGWADLQQMVAGARATRCPKDAPPEEPSPDASG
jgi:hypothetical protein